MERKGDMATFGIQEGEIVPARLTEGDGKSKRKTKRTEWVIQVEKRLENEEFKNRESSRDVCIFKVPRSIRDFKKKAYNAYVMPLGPFFHSQYKKDLLAVDDHKLRAVAATLQRVNTTKENLIDSVEKYKEKIRDCYEDRAVECADEELVWLMIMGACFIIELFYYHTREHPDFNLILAMRKGNDILVDILKLENQIPLLVLKEILKLGRGHRALSGFANMLCVFSRFLCHPFSIESESLEEMKDKIIRENIIGGDASHLLDLSRMVITDFLLGSLPVSSSSSASTITASEDNNKSYDLFPSAVKLTKAGIKFKQSTDGKVRLEKIGLGSATLSLPQIIVDDDTEIHLRNLMALEECQRCVKPDDGPRIISYYIMLLDSLIDSKEDVALLRKANIILNLMGSDQEVADMFNGLCCGITQENYEQYDTLKKLIEKHHDKRLHRWIAQFSQRYCSKPWLITSLVAAVLLLGMTAVQTAFSVKN